MQLSIYWNLRHAVALTMVFPREKESGWMDLGGWAAEGLGQLKLARVAGNTLKFIKFFVRRKHNISALWPTSGHKFVIFHFHLASLGQFGHGEGAKAKVECTLIWILMGNIFGLLGYTNCAYAPSADVWHGILQEALATYAEINLRDK